MGDGQTVTPMDTSPGYLPAPEPYVRSPEEIRQSARPIQPHIEQTEKA